MPRLLKRLDPRVSALLLLALALALLYWGAIEPWLVAPQQAISAQMADLREAQRRYSALLAQRERLQGQAVAAEGRDPATAQLLPGDDRNAAAAALMQYGADVITRHQRDGAGCELLNRTPLADEPGTEPFPQVQASFNLSCAIEPVQAILFDLETGKPTLFVTQLRLERTSQAEGPAPGRLEVQMTVAGYLDPTTTPIANDEGSSP